MISGGSPLPVDYRPLILTAQPEAAALTRFETLRRAYFPPDLNRVPAHISLFHQLPGAEFDAVVDRLRLIAREHPAPAVDVVAPKPLGRGVSLRLRSPALDALRADLADAWAPLLIPQDRAGFQAHVTIQNKVTPQVARDTLALVTQSFVPWSFHVTGIDVWRYLDGPWEHLKTVALRR